MARIVAPSRVQAGPTNSASEPPAIVVTSRDATSTTNTDDRPSRSGLRPPVRGERDTGAVGAPGGLALGRRPGHQRSCLAGLGVDDPQVRVVVVDEPHAVVLVGQPVDVAVVGQRRLAGLGLRRPAPAAACPRPSSRRASSIRTASDRPSGDHANVVHAASAGRSGGAPRRRRAAAGTPGRSRARSLASFGRSGSSSTQQPAVAR